MIEKKERNLKQEASGLKKRKQYSTNSLEKETVDDVLHVEIQYKDKSKLDIFIPRQRDLTYDFTKITAIPNVSDVINIKVETLILIEKTWLSRLGKVDSKILKKLKGQIGA